MFTFDAVNYSLRPNKVIQRYLVFDALELLARTLPINESKYIGFGSVWFADFSIAHKRLGISDLVSIEKDAILFKRAEFNAPFRTIVVKEGHSTEVLETLKDDVDALSKPWVIWLDYTMFLTDEVVRDMNLVVDHAPPNSILLVTVNAMHRNYGKGQRGRRDYISATLPGIVPDDVDLGSFDQRVLSDAIAKYGLAYLDARCKTYARLPGFIAGFAIAYRDNAPMVTFGGVLPSAEAEAPVTDVVQGASWPGFPKIPVETPPLTAKETQALLRLLPSEHEVTRAQVQALGFDLEDDKLRVYCAHYRRYPTFFQVVS